MLQHLLTLLLLETVQPSYGSLLSLMPPLVVASAQAQANVLGLTTPTTFALAPERMPIKTGDSIAPLIEAKSAYAMDLITGTPLFVRDIFTKRFVASITKLVTAMVILDNHDPSEILTVSARAIARDGSRMWLQEGEHITVGAVLTGMLVNSGNDAAVALAEFDAGNEEAFVDKMNAKAAFLGLRDSHFSNVTGFDERDNYSTAFDIMIFSRAALNYETIRTTVKLKRGTVTSVNGKIKHILENTNELLDNAYFNVIGLKTGRTPAAGQSFVSLATMGNGHEVVTIVLDSPNRFKETKILLDWISRNYTFP